MTTQRLRGGCVKAVIPGGEEFIACPGDPMYSTITMGYTHFWNEEINDWQPVGTGSSSCGCADREDDA